MFFFGHLGKKLKRLLQDGRKILPAHPELKG
jgi:hypothetical protein